MPDYLDNAWKFARAMEEKWESIGLWATFKLLTVANNGLAAGCLFIFLRVPHDDIFKLNMKPRDSPEG